MKINSILKKYKELHKKHKDSWEDAQKRIRKASDKLKTDSNPLVVCEKTYKKESYEYQLKGSKLLDAMMTELEEHEIFPKKNKVG